MKQLARHLYEIIYSTLNFSPWIFLLKTEIGRRADRAPNCKARGGRQHYLPELASHQITCGCH
jgi:hypothetical protein